MVLVQRVLLAHRLYLLLGEVNMEEDHEDTVIQEYEGCATIFFGLACALVFIFAAVVVLVGVRWLGGK